MHVNAPAPTAEDIRAVVVPLTSLEGPLLPMLHAVQHAWGHVPQAAVAVLADVLNLTRAEVHGVISFYHDFREAPAGRHVLKICRAEACQSMGGEALAAAALDRLGIGWHDTTANGAVTVEPVYCLGMCACAPAAMLDDRVVARLDGARMGRLLDEAGA
ncbi:formate dehydrogenase subunit gamma [Paracoccus spongiarum]|uniref:Formate dehydrogenase subunit gamma n=1 Tax=Paracoccus spongiarum TaxID=3064387 RepID=A0ABT9J7H3_9RHOB|nr:formate dehydrogenase subunit gamma [Paracoccus sp. 2205BS29-5]MDP5305753.1 formate dehydrogenase subunit gamma [Paracoccus sp. 2205BS29-5]